MFLDFNSEKIITETAAGLIYEKASGGLFSYGNSRGRGRRTDVRRLFPRALISCIRDGRSPRPEEVVCTSEKLWREGVAFLGVSSREIADTLARIALSGCGCATPARE